MSKLKILSPFWNSAWHFIWHIFCHSEFLSTSIYIYILAYYLAYGLTIFMQTFFVLFLLLFRMKMHVKKTICLGFLLCTCISTATPFTPHLATVLPHPPDLLLFPAIFGGWCKAKAKAKGNGKGQTEDEAPVRGGITGNHTKSH